MLAILFGFAIVNSSGKSIFLSSRHRILAVVGERGIFVKNTILAFALVLFCIGTSSYAFAQWSSDPKVNLGIAVKPYDQVQPKIRPTPDGGCYISWFDNDPNGQPPYGYDVFIQRLNARGVPKWADGGIRIADLGMSSTQDYGLDVDADGNALLAFLDDRNTDGIAVTATKVNPAGVQTWGKRGKQVGKGPESLGNPKVTATSDGFVVAGWSNGSNLTFQKIDADGRRMWGTDGITITAPAGFAYYMADLHAGSGGSVIVSFVSSAGFFGPNHLLVNKLSATGTLLWGANHVAVFDGGSLGFARFPRFITDGAGGAVFCWSATEGARVQHVRANGSEVFPHNGVSGSTNIAYIPIEPCVSYDKAKDATYLFWSEQNQGQATEGILAQKFNHAGVAELGETGAIVQPFTTSPVVNVASVFTTTGPLVVWSSETATAQDTIMGAKLNRKGALSFQPFAVSSALSSKSRLDLTLSSTGVAFVVWSDGRADDGGDIYAQNIKANCTLGK